MNEEMDATECSARTITDFPDAPWELRMFLARQCADEARHALTFKKLFEKRGGKLGEYPIMNFQYRIICKISDLAGRLAVQNRTFEAEGIDAIGFGIDDARKQSNLSSAIRLFVLEHKRVDVADAGSASASAKDTQATQP